MKELSKQEIESIEAAAKVHAKNLYKMIYSQDDLLKQRAELDYIAGATEQAIKAKELVDGLLGIDNELDNWMLGHSDASIYQKMKAIVNQSLNNYNKAHE